MLKERIMELLLFPVAIILILMGSGYIALLIVGNTSTAQVTNCEQVLFINNDDSTRNPKRYKLEYRFAVDGEPYTGSVTRVFEGDSYMKQAIEVRYLSFWPHINGEDSKSACFTGPIMVGLGVVVFVFGVKERYRIRDKS